MLRTPSPQSAVTAAFGRFEVRSRRFSALCANAPPMTSRVICSRGSLTLFIPSLGWWYSGSVW